MGESKVQIIDLGSGNLRSLVEAFKKIGSNAIIINKPEEMEEEYPIVLPGVGSFGAVAKIACNTGFSEEIKKRKSRQKILGVCLGMQLFLNESEEGCPQDGLGLIPGKVIKLSSGSLDWRVPNVGWRNVFVNESINEKIACTLSNKAFYHTHSYYASPSCEDAVKAFSVFDDVHIPVVIADGNAMGVQFHPEKSQDAGLDFLAAWTESETKNFQRFL